MLKYLYIIYHLKIDIIEMLWADVKRYIRKRPCKTASDLVYRIQKFFRYKLTPVKCMNYINRIGKVCDIIIARNGDWSDC